VPQVRAFLLGANLPCRLLRGTPKPPPQSGSVQTGMWEIIPANSASDDRPYRDQVVSVTGVSWE